MNKTFLKNDIKNKKGITIILILFIFISSTLIGTSTNVIINIYHSINDLFNKSALPSVVQMHTGTINYEDIYNFSENNLYVDKTQISEMITINNETLFLNSTTSEYNSVMDISFVKQNEHFDFLLNSYNKICIINSGEIGVPAFYADNNNISIGDYVTLKLESGDILFKVTEIIKDAQMNPSIVHSKRFLINEQDFNYIGSKISQREYLIEFILHDNENINDFIDMYNSANLPNNGPIVSYDLFLILNALTFGAIVLVVILISFLISLISILCIRFSLISTLEEDFVDIGILKAIGLNDKKINKLYLLKYFLIIFLSTILGFFASFILSKIILNYTEMYFGEYSNNISDYLIIAIIILVPNILLFLYSILVLRKFNNIVPLDAMNYNENLLKSLNKKTILKSIDFNIDKSNLNINLLVAIKQIFQRSKSFLLIFLIYTISIFIVIIPSSFSTTIKSPTFVNYMGIPYSDTRIDITYSDSTKDLNSMIEVVNDDEDISKKVLLVTNNLKYKTEENKLKNILVESGELSIFNLEYVLGNVPLTDDEISLSELLASDLNLTINDKLTLIINDVEKEMIISGIYQDITNGGRTAKMNFMPKTTDSTLWYITYIDYKEGINVEEKNTYYENIFKQSANIKVISMEEYINQTLSSVINTIYLISRLCIVSAAFIISLITYLYIKTLLLKDKMSNITLIKLGVNMSNVQIQYIISFSIILYIGLVSGVILSNTLGSTIVSGIWSLLGASKIILLSNPLFNFIILPLIMLITVTLTIILSTKYKKD